MSNNYKVCNSRICPRCGRPYTDPPALSRVDNETEICPMCGMEEALQEMNAATRKPEKKEKEKKYFPYWGEPPVDQDEYIKHKLSVQNGSRIFTGITRAEIIVGHDHFRMYGREYTAPLYNIDQYESMTAELMQDLLYRCSKGCRKLREGRIRF